MIRRCLIVDTETTALDPQKGKLIEFGAVLYSVTTQSALVQYSTLIPCSENPAVAINGISEAVLAEIEPGWYADPFVDRLRFTADVIVAHNAEFDRQWFKGGWLGLPWLCTMTQFSWPCGKEGDGLVSLALAHGIGVSSAHRALTDCQLIAALFDRMKLFGRDLQEMFAHAMRPSAMFQSLQPFAENEIAKAAGFQWNKPGPLREKRWTRRMAIEDAAKLPFKTMELK